MRAKERLSSLEDCDPPPSLWSERRPLLMVDVDGVISLFGAPLPGRATTVEGAFHSIDGIPHFLSADAGAHLLVLSSLYELVWASGWEERANEYLPHLLGLPGPLPLVRFPRTRTDPSSGADGSTPAHWKLAAIDAYAAERPLAWIDDAFNDACHEWAAARTAPTLLVQTMPERGLTELETSLLKTWARALATALSE